MENQITEMQAIEIAKSMLSEGFTISYMNHEDVDDFVWGYLFDNGLQYKKPIQYADAFGHIKYAIVYQDK